MKGERLRRGKVRTAKNFFSSRLFLLADLKVCEEKKSVKRKSPRTAKNLFYSKGKSVKRRSLRRGKVCEEEKSVKRKSPKRKNLRRGIFLFTDFPLYRFSF